MSRLNFLDKQRRFLSLLSQEMEYILCREGVSSYWIGYTWILIYIE